MNDLQTKSKSARDENTRRDEWTALYDEYSVRVWRYVARLIGADRNAVADAVQETFLAAVRGFDRFDPTKGTAWAWLTGIAHRQAALHWRKLAQRRIDADDAAVDEAFSLDDEPVALLERVESVELVRRVLAELPVEATSLLTGKYCDDLSIKELGELLGGSTEAVRSRLARARKEFRERYERASEGRAVDQAALGTLNDG